MIPHETRYTRIGDSWIAYQVVGDGPIDLVYVTGLTSNVETMWEWPPYARMLERMASYSRLILFDRRGSGISDPIDLGDTPSWEHWADDLRAVLDAAGSERTALLTQNDGTIWGVLFAAAYPERTSALVVWNGWVRAVADEAYPMGDPPEQLDAIQAAMTQIWGTPAVAPIADPSMMGDPSFAPWTAKHMRASLTPGAAVRVMRYTSQIDIRHVLPSVQVPTLVLHRRNPRVNPPLSWGRYVADNISGARFVEVQGEDFSPYGEGSDSIQDEIEAFLGVVRPTADVERILATVLFTDVVGSTEQASSLGDRRWKEVLAGHDRIASEHVARFRGRVVKTTGDGILATFDGPGRAISCANELAKGLEPVGIKIRAGLHTGEIELREGGDVGGIAVHIASRVMGEAGPGEVVCSRTVKDLVAGAEFTFEDRGAHSLKGVTEAWQLFAVRPQ
jgi:class 3 adenylate cyclase/pimeloyl-ACP methyl ester carboxylesterase